MRIVFFQWDLGRGGAEIVVCNLSNYLSKQGHQVHILTKKSKDQLSQRFNPNVRFTTFNKNRIFGSLIPLIRFIRKEDIDCLVSNVWPATIISTIASFFCYGFRHKLFLIEHINLNEESKNRSKIYRLFLRLSIFFLHNQAYKVIAVSNGVREDLISKGLRREKTTVIYNPACPILFQNEDNFEEEKRRWFKEDCLKISSVGHLHKQKNHSNLINAIDILKNEKKCQLVICLSHLGFEYNSNKISDINLAKTTANIDVILGGHTHTFFEKARIFANKYGKPVLINQAGWGALSLGRIDLIFNNE